MEVLPGFADDSALVQIQNAANLAIVDSLISNIPGNLMIQNSTIQVLRSTFILNPGAAAGAMTIDNSQVALLCITQWRHEHGLHLTAPVQWITGWKWDLTCSLCVGPTGLLHFQQQHWSHRRCN